MTDIVLFDTHQGARTALQGAGCSSVDWGSVGWSGKGDGTHISLFRDPREFLIVMSDSFNAPSNWQLEADERVEQLKREGRQYLPFAFPMSDTDESPWEPLSRYSFGYTQLPKFEEFLRNGGIMCAFAGPPIRVELPLAGPYQRMDPRGAPFLQAFGRRYGKEVRAIGPYFCFLPLDTDPKEENNIPGPAAVQFRPDEKYRSAFERYAQTFGGDMRWNASWSLSQARNAFRLFSNVAGDSVGFVQEHYRLDPKKYKGQMPGLLVVLPNIPDVHRRTEAIVHLLRDVIPLLRPGLLGKWTPPPEPPDAWFGRYDPPILARKAMELSQRRAEIEREERALDLYRERLQPYKELIRGKDEHLQQVVANVLRDVFGFEVADLDAAVPAGSPRGADLLAEKNEFSVLVETKGAANTTLQRQQVFAFVNNIDRYEREHGAVAARLLVMNGEAGKPPSERNRFSDEVLAYAVANRIAVISAVALFHLVERRLAGTLSDDEFDAMLISAGFIQG
jgi:hypothetical protein